MPLDRPPSTAPTSPQAVVLRAPLPIRLQIARSQRAIRQAPNNRRRECAQHDTPHCDALFRVTEPSITDGEPYRAQQVRQTGRPVRPMRALTLLHRMRILLAVLAIPPTDREDRRRPSEQSREAHRGVDERVGGLGLVDGEAALGGRSGGCAELLLVRAGRKRTWHGSERRAIHPERAGAQAEVSEEAKLPRGRSSPGLSRREQTSDNRGCNGRART